MELGIQVHNNCQYVSCDVAIIGGGISGLSLSVDLKKRGYNVVVIEKGNYPRHKVCGEYISMESYNYLKMLCPALNNLHLPLIKNFKLSSTGKKEFSTELGLGGIGISRYLLEDLLFKEAQKLGVIFSLNNKANEINYHEGDEIYSIKTGNEVISAQLVCNSSGRKSNLETAGKIKNLKGTNYVGVKYHVKLNSQQDQIEIHNFPGGYCGISSIEDGKSCLCYIVNSKKLKQAGNSIEQMEKTFLFENKNLKRIFTTAEFIFREPVTISGINFEIKKPVDQHSFFLGDSAGSIAPITGNGMSQGFRSAFVLAENIDRYLSKAITKNLLNTSYDQFWNKEFATRIKLSRHLQKLSEYPFLTRMTIGLFNSFPSLANRVIGQTHGKPF
ncbi:MAG: NAD(P)/FAD-dependent oxidoreductase [Burkholderiales bacterium]|nr:NAD(P)/FAD-dependent oxidoreductase [Bacteroidia bacterium]